MSCIGIKADGSSCHFKARPGHKTCGCHAKQEPHNAVEQPVLKQAISKRKQKEITNVVFQQVDNEFFHYSFTVGGVRKHARDNFLKLSLQSKGQLKDLCDVLHIPVDKTAKKADMIEAILKNPGNPLAFH